MKMRTEYVPGPIGAESARAVIEQSVGRTIAGILFGPDPAADDECHNGEYLVLRFADGSSLELQIGSNTSDFHGEYRNEDGQWLKSSDIDLSFIPTFIDGK